MRRINLNRPEIVHDDGDPEGFKAGYDRFGPRIGAAQLGGTIYEVGAGQALCPYHYEYPDEEWLIVLDGKPTLRHPGGEEQLEPGDVVCFPAGPEGAHQVKNTGTDGTIRVLMLSTKAPTSIGIYPDSDKIGIYPPNSDDKLLVRRESGVDYWDREK
jgi:uncharacterized cupin superfamily protein